MESHCPRGQQSGSMNVTMQSTFSNWGFHWWEGLEEDFCSLWIFFPDNLSWGSGWGGASLLRWPELEPVAALQSFCCHLLGLLLSLHPTVTYCSTACGTLIFSSETLTSNLLLSFELARKYSPLLVTGSFRTGFPGGVLRPSVTQFANTRLRCAITWLSLTLSLIHAPLISWTHCSNGPSNS